MGGLELRLANGLLVLQLRHDARLAFFEVVKSKIEPSNHSNDQNENDAPLGRFCERGDDLENCGQYGSDRVDDGRHDWTYGAKPAKDY